MRYYDFNSKEGRELHDKHKFKFFIVKQYIYKGELVCYPLVNIAFKDKFACWEYIDSGCKIISCHREYKIASGILDGFKILPSL